MRTLSLVLFAALVSLTSEAASAQTADRTIDEIRAETIARAQTGAYPALGIQPSDAEAALSRIKTRDPRDVDVMFNSFAVERVCSSIGGHRAEQVGPMLVSHLLDAFKLRASVVDN